jgi:ribosomal protein S21|tara:strand:- start:229 stop:483 length:255 start_codon:yes stop_codon:yes gene_type:complete
LKIKPGKNPRWQDRPRATGYEVHVPKGDDPMRHYKRLKKRMTKDGFFQELKDRRYFISNVEKRREREKREKRMIAKERTKQSLL